MKRPKRLVCRREQTAATRSEKPSNLTPAQYQFALEYLSNGFNATAAYKAAHPNVTYATARMEGSRTLAKPCIRAVIEDRLRNRWERLHMSGDEALARVALDARADIRTLFDGDGKLLKPHEWPDEIANSVEAVDLERGKVKLVSKVTARRTILEVTGKVKGEAGVDQLVEAMRQTLERNSAKTRIA
jgi:phage terminase small subunit